MSIFFTKKGQRVKSHIFRQAINFLRFLISKAEHINNIRDQPKGFCVDLEIFHNKKEFRINKRGNKGANLGNLVKNPLIGACTFNKGQFGSYAQAY